MSAVTRPAAHPANEPKLQDGARMSQPEFHRLYEQTPEDFKAELIEGVVYVASPLKIRHGKNHIQLGTLLCLYEAQTPGVECCDNTTVILGPDNEPQPDLFLRVLPECGGQSRTTPDDYVEGPPELVAEVADSTRSVDLKEKRQEYARHGVLEYLVLDLRDNRLHWFDLRAGRDLWPDADGVYRIGRFPGLWLHGEGLIAHDSQRLLATLDAGLATREHAEFVERLAMARQSTSNG